MTPGQMLMRVTMGDGCWVWPGSRHASGYSIGHHEGQNRYVHRLLYELLIRPVPAGRELDHLCRNRACVNPDHLEAVSHRENLLRGAGVAARNAQKLRCIHGHPFDQANTYRTRAGRRQCRTCNRARTLTSLAKKRTPA